MTYKLAFLKSAKKEWDTLDQQLKKQFKKKLVERLENPRIKSSRLNGMKDCYKIKLRGVGYRLVYQVFDETLIISVIVVGKRERNKAYKTAIKRI